jgi:hypothetical protein
MKLGLLSGASVPHYTSHKAGAEDLTHIVIVTNCDHKKCSQDVRRLLKSQRSYFFSMKKVMKMENRIRLEIGWKQKARDNFTLRTQRLFGVVRNIFCKLNDSESATHFPAYQTAKMRKTHESKAEQEKAEAIGFLHTRTLTI